MVKDSVQLEVIVDMTERHEKIKRLVELLEGANSLADELAPKKLTISIYMKC